MDDILSTSQVCKIAGITPRMLQYWNQTGAVPATIAGGSGYSTMYSASQVRRAIICATLCLVNQKLGPRATKAIPERALSARFLLFNGVALKLVAVSDETKEIISIGADASHSVVLVDLSGVIAKV